MRVLQIDTEAVANVVALAGGDSKVLPVVLIIIIAIVGYALQVRLHKVFERCSKLPSPNRLTGAEMAEKMLHAHDIYNVQVTRVRGHLANHFNPETLTINLSNEVHSLSTVTSMAVACHEVGHALQYVTGYNTLKHRSHLIAIVDFSSRVAPWLIIGGLVYMAFTGSTTLCWWGIWLTLFSVFFALVGLSLENNTSSRVVEWIESRELLVGKDLEGARLALRWVACQPLVKALSPMATVIDSVVGIVRRKSNK